MTPPAARLTAVMCNYNHGHYVARAIEAVVAQSRPPDEFIILDDGSTDRSVSIIESFAQRHAYIRFVRNERNAGVMAALQRANEMVTGDYVYWGAADDYVLPGFFEKAMALAKLHPQAGCIVGQCVVANEKGHELTVLTWPEWADTPYVAPDSFLNSYLQKANPTHSFPAAVIFNRQHLLEVGGFRQQLGFFLDTFAFRAIGLRTGICFVNQRCAVWHSMPTSVTSRTMEDPKKELLVLDSVVELMTSVEFNAQFPADYVAKWSADYRRDIVERAVSKLDDSLGVFRLALWSNLARRSILERALKWVLIRFDHQYRSLLKLFLRHSLNRYSRRSARLDA